MTKRMTVEGEKKGKNVLGVAPDDEPERKEEKDSRLQTPETTTQTKGHDTRHAYSIQLISHKVLTLGVILFSLLGGLGLVRGDNACADSTILWPYSV